MKYLTVVACALVVMGAGCSSDGAGGVAGEANTRLQRASQGLCDAGVLASKRRIPEAADTFQDRTHAYLHQLAARLQEDHPRETAALLEAKQRLERAIEDPLGTDPVAVVDLISGVQRALGDAASAAGLPAPLCREGAS